jgi:hypothetical protein
MTSHTDRPWAWTRKLGYLAGVVADAVLLVVLNVQPGWEWFAFLTVGFADVLWLVNLSMIVSAAVNLAYMWSDPAWFKSVGQIVTSAFGLAASLRVLQAFPFDFSAYEFPWATVVRVLLVVGVIGSGIAIVVELGKLIGRGIRIDARDHTTGRPHSV